MIATGTIEEKILALQQRKAALAEALWSEDAATPASNRRRYYFLVGMTARALDRRGRFHPSVSFKRMG
jgi:hypothetical protein